MRDDEIVVNDWLARDLELREGSEIGLVYFLPESGAKLAEATNRFRVRAIVPMTGAQADRTLMPDFPGLEKAETPGDWETSFPLSHKIRKQDEDYWKAHRGTPKAFVSYAAGTRMWANRFGTATAVRILQPSGTPGVSDLPSYFETELKRRLGPGSFGLEFDAVRDRALRGAAEGQDFGQLFLGFSFFLVISALLLMSVFFQFGLEQRRGETGILLALGFAPSQVRAWRISEGAALAAIGGAVGLAGGVVYARAILWGMDTIWREAVGSAALDFHWRPASLAVGFAAGALTAWATLWWGWRRQARASAVQLLSGETVLGPIAVQRGGIAIKVAVLALGSCLGLVIWGFSRTEINPGVFFGAGALLILAGACASSAWLSRAGRQSGGETFRLGQLRIRGCGRRAGRSLAVAVLLALGTFLVVSISVFRLDARRSADRKQSGTGGFSLIGQTALPVYEDLAGQTGLESTGLNQVPGLRVTGFRVQAGDDANCLNLNRATRPTLLGVQPEKLQGRFVFAGAAKGLNPQAGWGLLKDDPSDAIPAIGDANSIQWSMGKKLGDTLEYTDERGVPFKIRLVGSLANSILQGYLVIDEAALLKKFPSRAGWSYFLIDTPRAEEAAAAKILSRTLQDKGMEATSTVARLDALNAVQNTYLSTFQVLGGLGLLLGSAGLGAILLRNVWERRSELAVLRAIGFSSATVQRLVLGEHLVLLGTGLILGCGAAAVAVLPAWMSRGVPLPAGYVFLTLVAVGLNALVWTWLATVYALRGNLLAALRNE